MAGYGGKREGAGRKPGIPNKATAEIKELARVYGPAAIEKLARLSGLAFDDTGQPIEAADSEQTQLAAMKELLDRGYGKATQPISGDDDGPPIRHSMKVNLVRPGGPGSEPAGGD